MDLQNFLASFHIGAASGWDLFIILVFLIAVFIYGFCLGRNRMIILLLGSYFSLAIMQVLPWARLISLKWLGIEEAPSPSLKILVFLGFILLFYFLIPRSILSSALRIRRRGEASWVQLFILSILQIGLLVVIIFSFLPVEVVATFTPLVKKIFIGPDAQFVWITLPILTMVLMRKKRKIEE
jgi:hypothetical protein